MKKEFQKVRKNKFWDALFFHRKEKVFIPMFPEEFIKRNITPLTCVRKRTYKRRVKEIKNECC